MSRVRSAVATLCLLALPLLAAAAPVPVGAKPKDVSELPVAANSMAVVQLNGVGLTRDRVVKMLTAVDADLAKKTAEQIDDALKAALEGRDLTALDPKGRLFVAFGKFGEVVGEKGPIAFLLPTTDYKTFQKKFLSESEQKSFTPGKGEPDEIEAELGGQTLYLVDTKGGYVVVTANKEMAEAYAGKLDKLTLKQLGDGAEPFLAADLALFVNLAEVNEVYGNELNQAKGLLEFLFQQQGGGLDKAQAEQAKKFLKGAFQVVLDGKGLVIGVEARPEGANLSVSVEFRPDTESAELFQGEKPAALIGIGDLPAGLSAYSTSSYGKKLAEMMGTFAREIGSEDGDEKAEESIAKLYELMAAATGPTVTGTGEESSSITLTELKDADGVSKAMLTVVKNLTAGGRYRNIVLKEKPGLKEGDQKAGGFTLHATTVEVDYEAAAKSIQNADAREAAIESMKKLVPAKQTIWFGSDGKRFVQVQGKDWEAAKKLLDATTKPTSKAGDDKAFAAARKQLPAEASYLALFDAASAINGIGDSMKSLGSVIPAAPGGELPKLEQVKGDRAYVGLALAARPSGVRFDLFVPTGAVKLALKAMPAEEK